MAGPSMGSYLEVAEAGPEDDLIQEVLAKASSVLTRPRGEPSYSILVRGCEEFDTCATDCLQHIGLSTGCI